MSDQLSRKRKNNIRKHDSRNFLLPCLERSGFACHWCKRPLKMLRGLEPSCIVHKTCHTVTFNDNGVRRHFWIATLDHVVPLSDDGPRTLENCVASCSTCNSRRQSVPKRKRALKFNAEYFSGLV